MQAKKQLREWSRLKTTERSLHFDINAWVGCVAKLLSQAETALANKEYAFYDYFHDITNLLIKTTFGFPEYKENEFVFVSVDRVNKLQAIIERCYQLYEHMIDIYGLPFPDKKSFYIDFTNYARGQLKQDFEKNWSIITIFIGYFKFITEMIRKFIQHCATPSAKGIAKEGYLGDRLGFSLIKNELSYVNFLIGFEACPAELKDTIISRNEVFKDLQTTSTIEQILKETEYSISTLDFQSKNECQAYYHATIANFHLSKGEHALAFEAYHRAELFLIKNDEPMPLLRKLMASICFNYSATQFNIELSGFFNDESDYYWIEKGILWLEDTPFRKYLEEVFEYNRLKMLQANYIQMRDICKPYESFLIIRLDDNFAITIKIALKNENCNYYFALLKKSFSDKKIAFDTDDKNNKIAFLCTDSLLIAAIEAISNAHNKIITYQEKLFQHEMKLNHKGEQQGIQSEFVKLSKCLITAQIKINDIKNVNTLEEAGILSEKLLKESNDSNVLKFAKMIANKLRCLKKLYALYDEAFYTREEINESLASQLDSDTYIENQEASIKRLKYFLEEFFQLSEQFNEEEFNHIYLKMQKAVKATETKAEKSLFPHQKDANKENLKPKSNKNAKKKRARAGKNSTSDIKAKHPSLEKEEKEKEKPSKEIGFNIHTKSTFFQARTVVEESIINTRLQAPLIRAHKHLRVLLDFEQTHLDVYLNCSDLNLLNFLFYHLRQWIIAVLELSTGNRQIARLRNGLAHYGHGFNLSDLQKSMTSMVKINIWMKHNSVMQSLNDVDRQLFFVERLINSEEALQYQNLKANGKVWRGKGIHSQSFSLLVSYLELLVENYSSYKIQPIGSTTRTFLYQSILRQLTEIGEQSLHICLSPELYEENTELYNLAKFYHNIRNILMHEPANIPRNTILEALNSADKFLALLHDLLEQSNACVFSI